MPKKCLLILVFLPVTSPASQTSSANQETTTDWPKGFHPAKAADYSCAPGSHTSSSAGQDNHHPAPADHCATCGETSSSQHPTSSPSRSVLTLRRIQTWHTMHMMYTNKWLQGLQGVVNILVSVNSWHYISNINGFWLFFVFAGPKLDCYVLASRWCYNLSLLLVMIILL